MFWLTVCVWINAVLPQQLTVKVAMRKRKNKVRLRRGRVTDLYLHPPHQRRGGSNTSATSSFSQFILPLFLPPPPLSFWSKSPCPIFLLIPPFIMSFPRIQNFLPFLHLSYESEVRHLCFCCYRLLGCYVMVKWTNTALFYYVLSTGLVTKFKSLVNFHNL